MDQAALRAVTFFRNLPGTSVDALIQRLRPERFGRGTLLFQRGEPGTAMYFIESGQLEAIAEAQREPLAVLGPGGFVGEIALLLDQPRSAPSPPAVPPSVALVAADVADAGSIRRLAQRQLRACERLVLHLPPAPSPAATGALGVSEYVVVFGPCPDWVSRGRPQHRVLHCDGTPAALERTVRWIRGRAIGLALSSGGSKTVAHLGVLRVLRQMGIAVDAVAGTSGGAVMAAALACGLPEAEMLERLRNLARSLQFRSFDFNMVPRSALSKGVRLRQLFADAFSGRTFGGTDIPLWLVASDLATGEEVVINSGPVADGVRASMSMPVFFNPWRHGERLLIDGAVCNPLPASVLREAGIRFVVGSNVAGQKLRYDSGSRMRAPNMLQIVNRVMNSMEREMLKAQSPLVDVMIRPRLSIQNPLDFSRVDEFIAEGERAARIELAEATVQMDLRRA